MKTQKGITLIALIITIIVMLILVGVTINVALSGGLFDKAKTASEQTQRETDKEQLLSAVIGTLNNDGTVNEAELQAHLPDGFEYVSSKNVYKNTVTEKEYTINLTTGKVTEVTNSGSSESGQNTDGNEQQTPGNTSVAGTYNAYISNGLTSIVLNDDSTTGKMYMGSNEMPVTYEYDEENSKINISMGGQSEEFDYVIIGSNKILYSPTNLSLCEVFTTNEKTGITPLTGTYKNQDNSKTFTFTTNGVFNDVGADGGEGIYCLINNTVYTKTQGNFNHYEINNDYTQIELPDYTLYLQQ